MRCGNAARAERQERRPASPLVVFAHMQQQITCAQILGTRACTDVPRSSLGIRDRQDICVRAGGRDKAKVMIIKDCPLL